MFARPLHGLSIPFYALSTFQKKACAFYNSIYNKLYKLKGRSMLQKSKIKKKNLAKSKIKKSSLFAKAGGKVGGKLPKSKWKLAYLSMLSVFVLSVIGYSAYYYVGQKNASAYYTNRSSDYFYSYARMLNQAGCPYNMYLIPNTIQRGSSGNCVRHLQRFLNAFNFFKPQNRIAEDGSFGPSTETQVRAFQDWLRFFSRTNSGTDGVVGPSTWTGMYYCYRPGTSPLQVGCYAGDAPWL